MCHMRPPHACFVSSAHLELGALGTARFLDAPVAGLAAASHGVDTAFGLAGAVYQAVTRNPVASPR